jgi:uncharacterized protein (TIGR02118 family)
MIKVSVMYPYSEGARFDAEYYVSKHIPLVEEKVDTLRGVHVDVGVPGPGGRPPTYVGIGHLLFDSADDFGAAFGGPAGAEIAADVGNYTDIVPQMQFSEVLR